MKTQYRKLVKFRTSISVLFILFGAITLAASLGGLKLLGFSEQAEGLGSWYGGSGAGLLGAGAALFVKNRLLLKDEEKLKKSEILEYDERNLYLRDKTMVITGYLLIAGLYVSMMILGFANPFAAQILLMVLGSYLVGMCGVYAFLKRRV
ncbi:MAG: hypothetical protein HFG42_00615 [Lachnospiraceae bacterium]|jgi:uncharacterized membrane protein|nr:hypothetical protein [Lachnospiraceae bacterium]